VAIALLSTWTALGNSWVQDDIPIILGNQAVHSLERAWELFAASYWPEPFPRELYRPVTMLGFAVQWAIGEGTPLVYRITSILLYMAATLAVWRLARRFLGAGAAWAVAALFAAHPVHVESVAVAVNQAELLVALLLTLITIAWIDRRRAGRPTDGWWGAGVVGAYFVAGLVKEHAFVLPVLLVALELTVLDDGRPLRERVRANRMVMLGFALVVAVAVGIRDLVLAGNTKGSFTAEALVDSGVGGRALTMLGVVPEWARLLIWPAHLRAEYSPREIIAATGFGSAQLAGVALLLIGGAIIVLGRRRLPVAAFGFAWLAIGLGPVHNVLVPTGIVLAERTLFLGSIGFLVGVVALGDALRSRLGQTDARAARIVTVGGLTALLLMGITRSASRQRVWLDPATLWRQTLIDAPLSYRAHHAWAQILWDGRQRGQAERYFRRAIELYPPAWPVYVDLADKYRLAGQCWPAIELYQGLLSLNPLHTAGRGSLVACLIHVGRYREAAGMARVGEELGISAEIFARYAVIADSAAAVSAIPGTVSLPPPPEDTDRRR
jgi:hypothetical protein